MEQVAAVAAREDSVAMEEEDAPVDADQRMPDKDDAPAPAACDDLNPEEEAAAPVPAVVAEAEAPRSPEAAAPASADEVWVDDGHSPPGIDLQPPPDELEASSPRSSFSGALSPARSAYGGGDAASDDDGAASDDDSGAEDSDGAESGSDGSYDGEDYGRFGFRGESYEVVLAEPRLGMTLENVLEQTVVHDVDAGGAAAAAGMRRGALLVAIGGESTFGLLHDEVIDRLRQPRRPLVLTVRDVPEDALEARRSEARTYAMAARGPTQTGDDRLEAAGPLVAAAAAALRDARFLPRPDVSQISSPPPPPSLKAPIATPPKSPDAAAARYFGDVDDDDDESDDTDDESAKLRRPKPYAVALEECGAALAALDDACARPTRSGRAARRALRVCEDALASGLCAAVECAEPARLGGGDGLPGRRGPRPGQAGHPAADTDDDARLAQLAVDCAALAGGGDGAALERWAAVAAAGCGDGRSAAVCASRRAARLLARLARGARTRPKAAAATVLKVVVRLAAAGCGERAAPRAYPGAAAQAGAAPPRSAAAAVNAAAACCAVAPAAHGALPERLRPLASRAGSALSRAEEVHLLHCKLMPVATALAEDAAPEVRAAAARRAGALCDAFGPKRSAILVDEVHSLVEDADVRVRCAAARALPAVARAALRGAASSGDALGLLTPAATRLASDPNADARAALAAAVGGFLDMLCADVLGGAAPPPAPAAAEKSDDSDDDGGETSALDRAIFPLLLILVNDEVPDVACTALRALASAGGDERLDARCAGLRALLEHHHVAKLVLSLQDLATSRHWRVRAAAVAVVPALAPCCAADRALRNLSNLANGLSFDVVDEVRRAAARALCATARAAAALDARDGAAGGEPPATAARWLDAVVLPELHRLGTSPRQRDRKLALVLALDLAGVLGALPPEPADRARAAAAALAMSAALDAQPVVRLGAARLLATPHFASPGDRRLALDAATRLGDDGDPDVAREAKIASKVLSRRKKDPLAAALANLAV
ncbi:hypothetical protein AURANDRAFT_61608 [Aureococcus anophagefferens]|uniref:PDZ domain-containing protein n=1 Tax=Aureococcus anophagefferens TaxID=44056 RepID=F0Y0P9_AURAN|nr:hypothetical protein AURANDRAFT_61608 [Aureococcus anophagefferens]EGB11257.1 hypothetical protein AURANDRAFT_61608 [Aureococcus anophagefferens]|eukprot:XP_009033645.1 hypothetical protein AURANDRAFT_61608 [Aureococcus anophagefferens]